MTELFRTSKMEESVLLLDKENDTVMVRATNFLQNPIRIRVKMLQSIRPFYLRNAPEFEREAESWKLEHGTLINYRPFQINEQKLPHDAGLICECPSSHDDLANLMRDCKSVCVVFHPPTWRQHEEAVYQKYPPATSCKRLVQAVLATKPTQEMLRIAQVCGIPTAGTYACPDDVLQGSLQMSVKELRAARRPAMRSVQGRRYSSVIPLVPRIEPDEKSLLSLYQFIVNELPRLGHLRLARDNVLAKVQRYWKIALRALVRSGSVERKTDTAFYFMDGLEPDYARIQADHMAAKSKLARIIETVDALPQFPARQEPSRSASAVLRESAERPGDISR